MIKQSKHQYIFLIAVCMVSLALLLFFVFRDDVPAIFFSELFLVLIGLYAVQVYRNLFQPLNLLKDGVNALKDEDFNVRFRYTDSKEINELISVYNAMMDQLRAERISHQEQNLFLERLLDVVPISIIILDYDNQIEDFNSHAKQHFSLREENKGQLLSQASHAVIQDVDLSVEEPLLIKAKDHHHYRVSVNHFVYRGFPKKFIVLEPLTQEIHNTEKNAYGKIIRMMSHEVNNSIGAINSILHSILAEQTEHAEDVQKYLLLVIQRNEQLNWFMKNFAQVVRLPQPQLVETDINEVLQSTAQLFYKQFEDLGVELVNHISTEPFMVQADPSQLQQVLINVVKNAIDSLQETNRKICIESNPDEAFIKIIDYGTGIDASHQDKLFTPFFSTKQDGQGIGLTLSKEILLNHGFGFDLYTKNGQTEFVLRMK